MRQWHSGPPPHIGWWEASAFRNENVWRWWDGHCWSAPVSQDCGPVHAARLATCKVGDRAWAVPIEWTHYWPANARVPRIKP